MGYLFKTLVLINVILLNFKPKLLKTDQEILIALSKNDSRAYEKLYASYFAMAKYFIIKNSGNFEEAQDVFQDAIIVLFEKTKSSDFKLSCTLKTYIYSIVRNLWLKVLSKKKIKVSITDYEKYYQIPITEEHIEDENQINKVTEAIKQLGEKCRQILTSFYFEKKKMTEIADELGYTNAENAKNQKYKCMQQLKKLVKS